MENNSEFKPYEEGIEWHWIIDRFRKKYGADWSHWQDFDFSRLTLDEFREYEFVYNRMLVARGLRPVRLQKGTGEAHPSAGYSMSKPRLAVTGGQGFSLVDRARYRITRRLPGRSSAKLSVVR